MSKQHHIETLGEFSYVEKLEYYVLSVEYQAKEMGEKKERFLEYFEDTKDKVWQIFVMKRIGESQSEYDEKGITAR